MATKLKSGALVETFHDKFPWLGPLLYALTVQNFVVTVLAALAFKRGYDWASNPISDLGNSACGGFAGRYVCSPWHLAVNFSFVALGLAMALGALLIYQEFRENAAALAGFTLLAAAGAGAALVGFFPENTIYAIHLLGAALVFLLGNAGLVVLSFALSAPRWLKLVTFVSGALGLAALALLAAHIYTAGDYGLVERVTAYPQIIWLIIFGIYMSRNHFKRISRQ